MLPYLSRLQYISLPLTQVHCLSVFRQRNTALFIVNRRRSGRPTSSTSPSWKIRIETDKVNQMKTSRKAQTGGDCRGIPPRYFRASSHCALLPGRGGIMGRQMKVKSHMMRLLRQRRFCYFWTKTFFLSSGHFWCFW